MGVVLEAPRVVSLRSFERGRWPCLPSPKPLEGGVKTRMPPIASLGMAAAAVFWGLLVLSPRNRIRHWRRQPAYWAPKRPPRMALRVFSASSRHFSRRAP
eukprot:1814229-Pyramimonas_sp.AAC.1